MATRALLVITGGLATTAAPAEAHDACVSVSGRGTRQVHGPRGEFEYVEDRRSHSSPKPMRARLAKLTGLGRERLEAGLAPSFVITPHVLRGTFACTHAINIELGLGAALAGSASKKPWAIPTCR